VTSSACAVATRKAVLHIMVLPCSGVEVNLRNVVSGMITCGAHLPSDNWINSRGVSFPAPCNKRRVHRHVRRHELYHCHYAVSGYQNNEFSSIKKLEERKLCIRSRPREQSFVSVNVSTL
jgi:hypothetical protein